MAQATAIQSLTATTITIPAKNLVQNNLNLRTFSPILCTPPLLFSAKPISAKPLPSFLRSNPSQKYIYPDPNPDFAIAETRKFREELVKKLSKEKETFGDELDDVVNVCAEIQNCLGFAVDKKGKYLVKLEIFSEFLCTEYGGPGTLLVEPFTDMMVALKENKLPGAPLAARASLLLAQNFVDQDWEIWNSTPAK